MAFSNFQFSDFLHTNVSQVNTPFEWEHVRNIYRMDEWLEAISTKFNHPIIITSGYRTPVVNQKVGGVKGSAHTKGLAVDITTEYQYGAQLVDVLKAEISTIDQLIIYYDKVRKGVKWVHIAIPDVGKEPRQQILIRYK